MRDTEWNKTPLKKAGDPEDIANAVLFLASDEAKYITGRVARRERWRAHTVRSTPVTSGAGFERLDRAAYHRDVAVVGGRDEFVAPGRSEADHDAR